MPLGRRSDWSGEPGGPARALIRPGSVAEVAEVLRLASDFGCPIVVQGGNTSLVRGAIPAEKGAAPIIVAMDRLVGTFDEDPTGGQLTARAGTTVADVRAAAESMGWIYGVDLASRDSATIGGTVATNAGGLHVCAYGSTRAQLLGVEAVLADGSVLSDLRGLAKDNTGYDIPGLLCGSEGTLAVVTAVRLRLHRPPRASTVVALPVPTLAVARQHLVSSVLPGYQLLAAEVVDAAAWRACAAAFDLSDPVPGGDKGWVLLLEVVDGGTGEGFGPEVVDSADAVAALDAPAKRTLYTLREMQTEYWSQQGHVHKFDVSLVPSSIDEVVDRIAQVLDDRDVGFFGHINEANLHIQVAAPAEADIDEPVLGIVAEAGGSISAEHGIGLQKAELLGMRRSPQEIRVMRAIKNALDPQWLLNPGVLLPR